VEDEAELRVFAVTRAASPGSNALGDITFAELAAGPAAVLCVSARPTVE
jgi:hypothetical protein